MRPLAILLAAVPLALGARSSPATAQTLRGSVVDSASGAPVEGASVALRGTRGLTVVTTNTHGRFELEAEADPPFEVTVERLGYAVGSLTITEAQAGRELRIAMVAAALTMDGVEVLVERERLWRRWSGSKYVTDRGIVWPSATGSECYFVTIDSVVVKDPDLLRSEVIERYQRADMLKNEPHVSVYLRREDNQDPRLLRDAWPCGTIYVESHRRFDVLRSVPDPPAPGGHEASLAAESSLDLPAPPPCPEALAVSPRGAVALVAPDERTVVVHSPSGDATRTIDVDSRVGERPCELRVGWRGDTLWISDAGRMRVMLHPPDGPPEGHESRGVPETGAWGKTERSLPSSLPAMDLPVPVPLPDGRWLWTAYAEDPAYWPLHPDDPPGRTLAVLDDAWELDRVLLTLHPGASVVDLVLGAHPVLGDQPFGDHPLVALDPAGRHVTVVRREHQLAAWMTVYRVLRIGTDGDTIFHAERKAPLVRVTDRTFERTVAELAGSIGAREAFPGQPAEVLVSVVRPMVYRPPHHPPVSALLVGSDGSVWLRWPDPREGPVRWEVLGPTGEPLRHFMADRRLELVAADGDDVWGTLPHEEGGLRLVRYRLEPIASTGPPR